MARARRNVDPTVSRVSRHNESGSSSVSTLLALGGISLAALGIYVARAEATPSKTTTAPKKSQINVTAFGNSWDNNWHLTKKITINRKNAIKTEQNCSQAKTGYVGIRFQRLDGPSTQNGGFVDAKDTHTGPAKPPLVLLDNWASQHEQAKKSSDQQKADNFDLSPGLWGYEVFTRNGNTTKTSNVGGLACRLSINVSGTDKPINLKPAHRDDNVQYDSALLNDGWPSGVPVNGVGSKQFKFTMGPHTKAVVVLGTFDEPPSGPIPLKVGSGTGEMCVEPNDTPKCMPAPLTPESDYQANDPADDNRNGLTRLTWAGYSQNPAGAPTVEWAKVTAYEQNSMPYYVGALFAYNEILMSGKK
ncbi:MAG TPA: hypothetical protein VLG37_00180 [Candidatus Saccharimonadales bacterium]|nr:hypothetical protein [Candidatus Saccharimonadales bacterium]